MTAIRTRYTPTSQGTIADRVQAFFLSNPEEELSSADLQMKFDCSPNNAKRALKPLIDSKTLESEKKTNHKGKSTRFYRAGPTLRKHCERQIVRSTPAKKSKKPTLAELVIDFFRNNPEEELTNADIALKFKRDHNTVPNSLKPLLAEKILVCKLVIINRRASTLYIAGPALQPLTNTDHAK